MKLSIVTITFNDLKGLQDTYRSIRNQTFHDYEWVVVDGGSKDGTREFLQEHDSEIAWWCSEPDKGVYNAQNKGTQKAKGEYCIYMNSGDSFHADDVLEKIFERETDADIIYGDWMFVYEDGKVWDLAAPEVADMAFFYDSNICHQAMFVKTQLVLSRPYDETMKVYADWDEWLALCMQGKKFERRDIIVCDFLFGGLSTDEMSKELKEERRTEIEMLHERYYPKPWREAMNRAAPILREYDSLRNWMGKEGKTTSIGAAFGERLYLLKKRKKHNRIIRILICICSLLLATNIATILYIICR
jgi:glycosyltransferase involved in cell wall biosynthesis